jgi:iron complex transport system ATP-binding protein
MNDPYFELQHANVWRGDRLILPDISLQLFAHQSVAILGPNGSGKSSLLKVLTGELAVEAREESSCRLFGENLWSLEEIRHHIGVVMPEEVARFDDDESAFHVVLSSLRGAYGCTRQMRFSAREKTTTAAAMLAVGVGHLSDRDFGTLSSGERRRILIARSLVHQPAVLVLDEPSTALDFSASLQLTAALRSLVNEGRTLVLVTHHPEEIPPEIDRVILLNQGKIIADGPKQNILTEKIVTDTFGIALAVHWRDGWCHVRQQSNNFTP